MKNCEQNYNWLVKETKFRAPLKPICISQIICKLRFVFNRQQYFCTAVANFPAAAKRNTNISILPPLQLSIFRGERQQST